MKNPFDVLRSRKLAYIRAFSGPGQSDLLEDLARFCRAFEDAAIPGDHDRTWALIGRREVWNRIQQHLRLTDSQLAAIYQANVRKQQGEDS